MSNAEYSEDIYERLVAALDALPHGFARTPSGVEIRLIKMSFTPEEVWLAGQLTRFPETAAEISKRVGRDEAQVEDAGEPDSQTPGPVGLPRDGGTWLSRLRPRARRGYRLGPFLVGCTKPTCGCLARTLPSSSSSM